MMNNGGKWRRRGVIGVGLAGAIWLLYVGFLRWTRIAPPPDARALAAAMPKPAPDSRGSRTFVGDSWMARERGVWEYHLRGEPLTLG